MQEEWKSARTIPIFEPLPRKLEDYREWAWECARCKECVEIWAWRVKSERFHYICPAYAKTKSIAYAALGKMNLARALIDGWMDWKDSEKLTDFLFMCPLCGGCDIQCLRSNELQPSKVMEALRTEAIAKIDIPLGHKRALNSTTKYGNPFGIVMKEERLKWTESLGFKIKDLTEKRAEVLLYTECMYALEPRVQHTLKSMARILNAAGVDFGILGAEEKSSGIIELQMGERGLFEQLAKENIETFDKLGIKTLVTPDPHAYNAFKNYYVGMGKIDVEVLHITEYIKRLIDNGMIKLKELPRETVTYHDPCNLGRMCNIYDAPRDMLKAIPGIELREMERIKDMAWCCGAGGGAFFSYPDFIRWAAEERVKEAEDTGASAIVTACPWCEYNLQTGIEASKSKMKLYNVAELVEESMKGGK